MDTPRLPAALRRSGRLALLPALALAALLLPASAFAADSVSLTVDDPANGRATQIHVTTTAAATTQLFLTYKKASSTTLCAPTASADKGTKIDYAPAIPAGTGTIAIPYTFHTTGTYLFCSWLAPTASSPATGAGAQPIVIRSLKASIAISANPSAPIVGQSVAITMAGSDEVSQTLYAKYRLLPAGGSTCSSTASPDKGLQLGGSGKTVSGTFSQPFKVTFSSAGSWLICGWLSNGGSTTPLATASLVVAVRNPVETLAISSDAPPTGTQSGSLVTIKATGISEFGRTLYLRTRIDDGRGCGLYPSADPGVAIGKPVAVTGQYYRQLERAFPSGGSWLVCGWLATSESDKKPLAVTSTTVPIAGGPPLAIQSAVRMGRAVVVRLRRESIQTGERMIVTLKAPGWKGRTRTFTGHSAALTVHFVLPQRPLTRVTLRVTRVASSGAVIASAGPLRPRRLS